MRAAFAPIRAVIFGLLLGLAGMANGCAATSQGTPIGMSDAVPERAPRRPAATPRQAWPDFAAARAWPEAAPAFVARSHHRDGTLVHVRVESDGLAAYRDLAADAAMPDGARVVAWHEASSGALLGGYLLEKRQGVWSAKVLDASGALVNADGAACVRCHDMAPTDHLFGVRWAPEPAAPSVSAESILPAPR